MKKLVLTLSLLATFGSVQAKEHSKFMDGRSPFIYLGAGSSIPPFPTYNFSAEAGIWGTTKLTTFSPTYDAMKMDTTKGLNHWIGAKAYLSLICSEKAVFMVYASPKIMTGGTNPGMLEMGINPCFNITKHLLASFSIADQLMKGSYWNVGGSVGLVYIK